MCQILLSDINSIIVPNNTKESGKWLNTKNNYKILQNKTMLCHVTTQRNQNLKKLMGKYGN